MSDYDAAAWKLYEEARRTLEKSASDKGGPSPIPEALLGGAAVGSGAALFALRPTVYTQQVPNTNKVTVYYSDPRRGAGHFAQAKALAHSLKKQGAEVRLVNFDMEFVRRTSSELERDADGNYVKTPKALLDYNDTYEKWFRSPTRETLDNHLGANHRFYEKEMLHDRLEQAFSADERKVLTNIGLQTPVNRIGKPLFLLHTDQHPWSWIESESLGSVRHLHIASKTSANVLRARNPEIANRLAEISDLPIMPEPGKKAWYSKPTFRGAGARNITVSGGNLGMNVVHATEELISSGRVPNGTVIHAVAGKDPATLAALKHLEATTKGSRVEVRAYGFAPLREMMAAADINVLNPNGTSITEAASTGKPFVLYLPPDGAREMDKNNVIAMATTQGTPVGTSYTGADVSSAKPRLVGDQVASIFEDYSGHHTKAKALAAPASGGADQAAKIILSTNTINATKNPDLLGPSVRTAVRHVREHGAGPGTFAAAGSKIKELGLTRVGARVALGAATLGAAGLLANRVHTRNPEILSTFKNGLTLMPSKTNSAVRRWQGDEHEKAAEEKQDWKGNAVGAAAGLGAAGITLPATVVADALVREDKTKKTPLGSLQRLTSTEGDLTGKTLNDLSDAQINYLQREHALQWLTSGRSAHRQNIMRLPGNNLLAIDKGNALRGFGVDRPSFSYKAGHSPYFRGQMLDYMEGKFPEVTVAGPRRNKELASFIKQVQSIPDDEFLKHFDAYFEEAKKEGFPQGHTESQFRKMVLGRKANLHKDMDSFYDEVEKKRAPGRTKRPAPATDPIPDDLLKAQKLPWAVNDLRPTLSGHIGGSLRHPKSVLSAPDGSKWLFKAAPKVKGDDGGARVAAAERGISTLSHSVNHPSANVYAVHARAPLRTSMTQKALLALGAGAVAGMVGKKVYDSMGDGKPKHASVLQIIPLHTAASYQAERHELSKLADDERNKNIALGAGAAGAALAVPALHYGDSVARKGKEGVGEYGSLQKLVPNKGTIGKTPLADLNDAQISHLQKEHALSWLTSEWDGHKNNILKLPDGKLLGIDKGNAFRYIGRDKLGIDDLPTGVAPNPKWRPYFTGRLKEYASGESPGSAIRGPKHNSDLRAFVSKVQSIPDDEYLKILTPFVNAADKSGELASAGGKDAFVQQALHRKANLMKDLEGFYANVDSRRLASGQKLRQPNLAAGGKADAASAFKGVVPDIGKLRASESALGGKHPKIILSKGDEKWLFKTDPAHVVEAERAANLIANRAGQPAAEVHATYVNRPYKTSRAAKMLAGGAALGMGGLLAYRTLGKDKAASVLLPHTVAAYWAERAEIEKMAWSPLPAVKGAYKAVGGAITNASRAVPLPVIEGAQRFITGAAATGGSPAAMLGYGTANALTSLAPKAAKVVAAPLGRAVQAAGYPTAARTVQKQVMNVGHTIDRWGQHATGLEFAT